MGEHYFLMMDLDSGNLVSTFETREEAFATVLDAYTRYGLAGVEDLGLSEEFGDGGGTLIGIGTELLAIARAASPSPVAG